MNLESLFRQLSFGELSNLALANDGAGTIKDGSKGRIVQFANAGLTRLYSRFLLSEKDLLLEQYAHITSYHLLRKFSESAADPDVDFPYIKDMNRDPFLGDVIKVLDVFGDGGIRVPLNDSERWDSVFTPQYNIIQIPYPTAGQSLGILYQASHRKLVLEELEAEDEIYTEIDLPEVLHEAFRAYIAHLVYGGMNTQEAAAISQGHYAKFEAICMEAEEKDLVNTSVSQTSSKFHKRGFC